LKHKTILPPAPGIWHLRHLIGENGHGEYRTCLPAGSHGTRNIEPMKVDKLHNLLSLLSGESGVGFIKKQCY